MSARPWPVAPLCLLLAAAACSPVTISRIGPAAPPRPAGCAVEVRDPGREPERPYRRVGIVILEQCQDYRAAPCRNWLVDAACELGGHVAWLEESGRPDSGVSSMVFRVTVAAHVLDLPADGGGDPFEREMRRRRPPAPDCEEDSETAPDADGADRCLE